MKRSGTIIIMYYSFYVRSCVGLKGEMMDGESLPQEVLAVAADDEDDDSTSGSHSPRSPEADVEDDLPPEAAAVAPTGEKRDPLLLHIKIADLGSFRPRKPKWYCYQCRVTYHRGRHLVEHLRQHVTDSLLRVRLVRLPLPADVVEAAARRYREAEIVERALQQAARDIRDGKPKEPVNEPFTEPFTLRLNEDNPEDIIKSVDPFTSRVHEVIQEEKLKEPFTLRLHEDKVTEKTFSEPFKEPFTLRLDVAEDGIPEIQAEINSTDEEESFEEKKQTTSVPKTVLANLLLNGTTSGSASETEEEKNDSYARDTLLGPDLSKTLFEISKSVIRDFDALNNQRDSLSLLPVPVSSASSEILAVEKVCNKVVEELSARLPLPKLIADPPTTNTTSDSNISTNTISAPVTSKNGERNISVFDPRTSSAAAEVLKSVNFLAPKKLSPEAKQPLPVPRLIPDPIYTVTKTSATGVNISISSADAIAAAVPATTTIDPKLSIFKINNNNNCAPKNAELKNALTETVKTLQLPPPKPVPTSRLPPSKETGSMEPERCQSVMILENESRLANNTSSNSMSTNSISANNTPRTSVRPAPTLMNHLLTAPPYRASSVIVPRRPSPPTASPTSAQPPLRLPPPILRTHWKLNNNGGGGGVRHAFSPYGGGGGPGAPPSGSELKIQQVVSLATKHVMEDPETTCRCAMCAEVKGGDLYRKCEQLGPNGSIGYKCAICGEYFDGKSQLLRHCRRTKHSYICALCGSGFLVHALYKMHAKVHEAKQLAAKMAVSTSGGGMLSNGGGPVSQPQHRTNDDEVMVVGERILIKSLAQRTKMMNGSANPAQLNRILHNSEITLTPIAAAGSNAGGKVHVSSSGGGSGGSSNVISSSGTGSGSLRRILPAPNTVAPPSYPLQMITTPISTANMTSLNELRKAVTSLAAHNYQQQMMASAGTRPTLPGNMYRMIPMPTGGPPRPAPTWHHPTPPNLPRLPLPSHNGAPRMPLPAHQPRLPLPNNNSAHRSPLPVPNILRQQMTNLGPALYKHILPAPIDPRVRLVGPPNVTLAPPLTNGVASRTSPSAAAGEGIRAPPSVAPVRCHVCNLQFRSIVSFQLHFDQVHKKARVPPPQQYKCKRCFRAYASIPQLQRHEPVCGEKVRCRKCNVLLYRNQVITHFALVHSEPGSGAVDPHVAQSLAKQKQQLEAAVSPAPSSATPPETEIIEVRTITRSPLVEITPSITVTPILTPPAPDVGAKTPDATQNEAGDLSAPEDLRHRPEVLRNSSPHVNVEITEVAVKLISAPQPEVVDLSVDSILNHNNSAQRPEVNENGIEPEVSSERSRSVEPVKDVGAVREPEVYTEFDVEAEIRKEMNLGLELSPSTRASPEAEVSRNNSPRPEVVNIAPEVIRNFSPKPNMVDEVVTTEVTATELEDSGSKVFSPEVSAAEFGVGTPEADVEDSEPEEVMEVEVERLKTPEIDLAMSPSVCEEAEERACVVCDRTFPDSVSLEEHLRTHTPTEPEAPPLHTCLYCRQTFLDKRHLSHHLRVHFTSCSPQKTTSSPPKRTLKSPVSASPAKRPRVDAPQPPPPPTPSASAAALEDSSNLAVAILDMNKLGASVEVFRRLGVVGFVSLKELKSFLQSDTSTGSPNFIKKF